MVDLVRDIEAQIAGARTDVYPEMQKHIDDVHRRAGTPPPAPEDV